MEKLKEKHNHTLTSILKVLTFAIVLLFPFLVFTPSAFYYGFNEHAKVEIPVKTPLYETNEVNSYNDLVIGNIYHFSFNDTADNYITNTGSFRSIIIKVNDYNFDNYPSIEIDDYIPSFINTDNSLPYIEFSIYSDYVAYFDIYFNSMDYFLSNVINGIADEPFMFDYYGILIDFNNITSFNFITSSDFNVYEITETTTISENLSNSWENMWQTPLFKWTENTPFTATTNAFASVFNISQESGFYNLIAYFITITGIYLIIDIVLGVATWLTHMIGRQD